MRDWDSTLKGGARFRLDLDEGWCETLHDITIHHIETWPWWRVVWDFTWWRWEVVTMGSVAEGKWCWSCGCGSHWNGCVNVACCVLWGGSRSTKPCVFPCKVAAGDDERYLLCAAVAAAVVPDAIGSFYVFCNNGCSCVRSSMRFLKLWLLIALEWLHECCMGYVLWRKPKHETSCFSV